MKQGRLAQEHETGYIGRQAVQLRAHSSALLQPNAVNSFLIRNVMNVRVVSATLDHLEDLVPLFDAYCVFYEQPSNSERARAFLSERFLLRESVVFLAYDHGDRALGFTQLYPIFTSIYMQRKWLLNDIYVVPEARGQRIGEKLIERAIEHARISGARGVMLETAHSNISGQKLYERMGFGRDDLEFRVYSRTV